MGDERDALLCYPQACFPSLPGRSSSAFRVRRITPNDPTSALLVRPVKDGIMRIKVCR